MASQGATALFIPTNNGLLPTKAGPEIITEATNADIARAVENSVSVIRADVAGHSGDLVSYGSTGIIDAQGIVLGSAQQLKTDLVVAEITSRAKSSVTPNGFPVFSASSA
jgi:5-aminopentanamidase